MKDTERTTTYGRKVVTGTRKKKSDYFKLLLISWLISMVIGFIIGSILSWGFNRIFKNESIEPATEVMNSTMVCEPNVEPISNAIPTPEPKITSLGEYKLTAYCSCEKCCGYWTSIRPLDEYGNPIVYTANMSVAKQGVTVAADTSVLPFDTKILIDGHEYTVQDRGGAIKGNCIDIYFESHEEALQFGVQYKEIFLKEE